MDQKEIRKNIETGIHSIDSKMLITAGSGFLVLILLVAGWFYYRGVQNRRFDAFAFSISRETQDFVERFENTKKNFGEEKAQAEAKDFRAKMIAQYREGIEKFGSNARSRFFHLEMAHLLVKDLSFDEAANHYRAFLETLPSGSPYRGMVLQNLAFCAEQVGQLEKARDYLVEAEALGPNPTREFVLFKLGKVEEKLGKTKEAVARYQALAKEYPGSALMANVQVSVGGQVEAAQKP